MTGGGRCPLCFTTNGVPVRPLLLVSFAHLTPFPSHLNRKWWRGKLKHWKVQQCNSTLLYLSDQVWGSDVSPAPGWARPTLHPPPTKLELAPIQIWSQMVLLCYLGVTTHANRNSDCLWPETWNSHLAPHRKRCARICYQGVLGKRTFRSW